MLGISSIGSASGTADYFAKDNYYSQEQSESSSVWHGKGAEDLGLQGKVDDKILLDVLKGKFGDEQFGKANHNPGRDFTFSMPKSASIVALIGGDKRISDAYMEAVKETMNYVEKYLVLTRQTNDRNQKYSVKTGNAVMAMFPHDTSRAKDANFHIHVLMANGTKAANGDYKAINFFPLYSDRYEINQMAQELFRNKVERLGYKTVDKDTGGHFEIVGVPQRVNDHFSKRANQIRALLKDVANPTWEQKQQAAYVGRPNKGKVRSTDLVAGWKAEAKSLGFDAEKFAGSKTVAAPKTAWEKVVSAWSQTFGDRHPAHTPPATLATLTDVARYAISAISEKQTSFTRSQIVAEVMAITRGGYSLKAVNTNIDATQSRHDLAKFKYEKYAGNRFTTKSSILAEKQIISAIAEGKGKSQLFRDVYENRKIVRETGLDTDKECGNITGQMAAAKMILFGKDRISGVQGYAGVGKTTLLAGLKSAADRMNKQQGKNIEFIGMAPTLPATAELASKLDTALTFQQFMADTKTVRETGAAGNGLKAKYEGKVVIIDEASMISSKEMRDFLYTTKKLGVIKEIPIGDTDQISSLDAGEAFRLMQEQKMETAVITKIFRQKNEKILEAVKEAIGVNRTGKKDIAASFKILDNYVSNHKNPLRAAARDYVNRIERGRELNALNPPGKDDQDLTDTEIITPTNRDVDQVTENVRALLKAKGMIGPDDRQFGHIKSLHLSHLEKGKLTNYKLGDTLVFNHEFQKGKFKGGVNYDVIGIDHSRNALILRHNGRDITFRIGPGENYLPYDVVKTEQKVFSEGDKVRFTLKDRHENIARNTKGTIISFGRQSVQIEIPPTQKGGEPSTISVPDNSIAMKGLTHNYASTIYGTQGRSISDVIVAMTGKAFASTYENFYVGISRAKHWVHVYTDDKQALEKTIARSAGKKSEHAISYNGTDAVIDEGRAGQLEPDMAIETEPKELEPEGVEQAFKDKTPQQEVKETASEEERPSAIYSDKENDRNPDGQDREEGMEQIKDVEPGKDDRQFALEAATAEPREQQPEHERSDRSR